MSYLKLPIETDPTALTDAVIEQLETLYPTWEPAPGDVEVQLIEAIMQIAVGPLAQLAADVPDAVFAALGEQTFGVPPIEALPATGHSTWTMVDSAGYTIPEGTFVDVALTGDEAVGFVVINRVEVPPGSTVTEAGEVLLEAVEAGEAGNALSGEPTLVDALGFVEKVVIVGETSGGRDAETVSDYLTRLTETLTTQAPRPIVPEDVAILLRNIPGVQRVAVLDNFNAETKLGEQEKTLSAYPVDEAGAPVSEVIADACLALLEAKREANFIFLIGTPSYNEIDVEAALVPRSGFSAEEARAQTQVALEDWLDSAIWGRNAQGDDSTFEVVDMLRYQDLVTLVNNVQAVGHYTTLKVGIHGKALGVVDVELEGDVPLTEPGTLTLT